MVMDGLIRSGHARGAAQEALDSADISRRKFSIFCLINCQYLLALQKENYLIFSNRL